MSTTTSKPLRPRHLKFVEGVLAGKPATQAYRDAGYRASEAAARRNASRLLTNADVASALAAAREKAMDRIDVTAEAIVARLWEEANDRSEKATHAGRVRALELLGRMHRLFADRHEHYHAGPGGGPIPVALTLGSLTDDELDRLDDLLGKAEAAPLAVGGQGGEGPPPAG